MPSLFRLVRNQFHPQFLTSLILILFIGCAHRPARYFPERPLEPFSESGNAEMPEEWWTTFEDPALNAHVAQALGENFNLSSALQRLRAARAVARREASDLFPHVNGLVTTDSALGTGRDRTAIGWGLDASYQVDLWGQIQSRVDAAELRASATGADYQAVALTLAAEVCRTWFALIESYAQLELLAAQVETNRNGLKTQELRFGRGFVRSPDVLRQRQLVESTLEQAVVVRGRIEVLEHQLAVLQGELPQSARYEPGSNLPPLRPLPNTGLPSELLQRRPDVRRDYLAFLAADQDLVSAVTAQYPRLNLTGALLNTGETPKFGFSDWFIFLGSQLVTPLIDGGQRRAEVDRTEAVTQQRFDDYQETLLIAFQEVENSLALEKYQHERLVLLASQDKLAKQSADQLVQEYLIGDAEYLDVLSQVQSQQRLQREILTAKLDLILIRIGLYLALAGDIEIPPRGLVGVTPAGDILENEMLGSDPITIDPELEFERLPPLEAPLPAPADPPNPSVEPIPEISRDE